tara:strand:- start:2710 stop:3819 length:1110 start_codon:yes stop_codon:yes gene_type:complete
MKTYEAEFNEDEVAGVYAISLVESPAMEGNFIALNKQESIQFKTLDEEKRIIVGLVLEPYKDIYRKQNGEEFNIRFSDKTIEKLCYNFTKKNNNSNSTIEHDVNQKIKGVSFVENWLVRDSNIDTAVALGLSCKVGSWMSVCSIDNDEIWAGYVKTGKVKGFSIDAMLSLKEVNLKSNINMSEVIEKNNTLLERLSLALGLADKPKEVIKLGTVKSADGILTYEFDGDAPEVGANMSVLAEDGTSIPVSVGEYEVEGGAIVVVVEEGIIGEIKEVVAEDVAAPLAEQTSVDSAPSSVESELEKAIKSILVKYSAQNKEAFESLKLELKVTNEKLVELSAQPSAKPIKSTPSQPETAFQKFREHNRKFNQ